MSGLRAYRHGDGIVFAFANRCRLQIRLTGFSPLSTVGWMRMLLGLMVFLSGSDFFCAKTSFFLGYWS